MNNSTTQRAEASVIIHEQLMQITTDMPMKQIDLDGSPYLRRYFAGSVGRGGDIWLHHFLSADGERHLHNHPFEARSVVLCGWYRELGEVNGMKFDHQRPADGSAQRIIQHFGQDDRDRLYGQIVAADWERICPMTWHRITEVQPDTWTLMLVKPGRRIPQWFFIDDDGNYKGNESSPGDWWKQHGTRAERELQG